MVQGGATFVKYLLFFFNLLFVLTGLAVIIVGAIIEVNARNYYNFLDKGFSSTAILLIFIGVIIFLIAFFGCCGAIKENHCMVMTFAVLLFIIFIMEFSAGIAAYVYRGKFQGILTDSMEENFKHVNDSDAEKAWNDMQKELECCGVHNALDYKNMTLPIPSSCCSTPNASSNATEMCSEEQAFTKGCSKALYDKLVKYQYTIGGVGIGIGFVQLVEVVFACCLARQIKKQYEVV